MTTFHASSGATTTGEPLVTVSGELDLASADDFLAEVTEAAGDGAVLVLDLAGVSFMDSTGLGALIKVRNRLVDRGGEITLTAVSPAVERVLELTGMSDVFGIG